MNKTAYLVAFLYPDRPFKIGIFSEPHPTTEGRVATAVIDEYHGEDFGSAVAALRTQARRHWPWMTIWVSGRPT